MLPPLVLRRAGRPAETRNAPAQGARGGSVHAVPVPSCAGRSGAPEAVRSRARTRRPAVFGWIVDDRTHPRPPLPNSPPTRTYQDPSPTDSVLRRPTHGRCHGVWSTLAQGPSWTGVPACPASARDPRAPAPVVAGSAAVSACGGHRGRPSTVPGLGAVGGAAARAGRRARPRRSGRGRPRRRDAVPPTGSRRRSSTCQSAGRGVRSSGLYRSAHAGAPWRRPDGHWVLARHDVVGADGWWRTWGEHWTPPALAPRLGPAPVHTARRSAGRVRLGPHRRALLELARPVVAVLRARPAAGSGARAARCSTSRLSTSCRTACWTGSPRRCGDVAPPLCEPVAPGVGLAVPPPNGTGFGEHRCHLVATGAAAPDERGRPARARSRPCSPRTASTRPRRTGTAEPDPSHELSRLHQPQGVMQAGQLAEGRGLRPSRRPRAGCGCGSGRPGCPGPSWWRR